MDKPERDFPPATSTKPQRRKLGTAETLAVLVAIAVCGVWLFFGVMVEWFGWR